MPAYAIDRRDVEFTLFEHLAVQDLSALEPFKDYGREDYEHIVQEALKMAREVIHPTNAPGDKEGCTYLDDGSVRVPGCFREAYQTFCEGGWLAITGDPEHGGMGLPHGVAIACGEAFSGANAAFMMYPGLTAAAANLFRRFGSDWMRTHVIPKLYQGAWQGTMALTEPQAGSAVGALTTKATPEGDHYLIEGRKIFISCAEHDLTETICHLVLARIPGDPGGTRGISIFLVPKHRIDPATGALGELNNVRCTGIEHKMGINGSATCALAFGEAGPCHGYLIGEPRQGMKLMFTMMNEARIATGMQGMAIAGVAAEMARAYAAERVQGSLPEEWDAEAPHAVTIDRHPDVRRMLLDMKATIEGLRALLYAAARLSDVAEHHLDEEVRKHSRLRLELLTPICKAFASDQGFRVTETAIQVLGGYGYCTEYGVEQYCRDAKISSVYEGTNGIQALDLLGRKLGLQGGAVFMGYMDDVGALAARAGEHEALAPALEALGKARGRLLEAAMHFMALGQAGDRVYPVLCATPFLEMFGLTAVAHVLLEQGLIAAKRLTEVTPGGPDARFYQGKIASARYWALWRLPHVHAIGKGILSGDRSALDDVF